MADVDVRSRKGSVASAKSATGSDTGSMMSVVGMKKTLGLIGGISYIIGVMIG